MIQIDYKPRTDINDNPDTKVYEFTPIQICFVGARGVGKTSLLASMHQEIRNGRIVNISVDRFNSNLGTTTFNALDKSYKMMLSMIDETQMGQLVPVVLGIQGTPGFTKYEFIGKYTIEDTSIVKKAKYKEFRFPFHFIDLPGGWYTDGNDHKEAIKDTLINSVASFVTIDTPALMENNKINSLINEIPRIESWYEECKVALATNKHTVIFVFTKAEGYWDKIDEIKQKMEKHYGFLISMLKDAGVNMYATMVKTLGGLKFVHYDPIKDESGTRKYYARFMRTGEYEPENCATPLQLALKHGLVHVIENMPKGGFLDKVATALGLSNRDIAIKSAEALAEELNRKLEAGKETSYVKL